MNGRPTYECSPNISSTGDLRGLRRGAREVGRGRRGAREVGCGSNSPSLATWLYDGVEVATEIGAGPGRDCGGVSGTTSTILALLRATGCTAVGVAALMATWPTLPPVDRVQT